MAILPESGFVRLNQIIGQKTQGYKREGRKEIPALLPMSRTSFLNKVKSGEYPQPVRLGSRTIAWRVEDIRDLLEKLRA